MPKWADVKARWQWLKDNLPDDEPVLFKLPRREARKRIKNDEGRKRVSFITDALGYSRFHARKEAWFMELGENSTLFAEALDAAMAEFDLRTWKENHDADPLPEF